MSEEEQAAKEFEQWADVRGTNDATVKTIRMWLDYNGYKHLDAQEVQNYVWTEKN